jgi:hypothetical protein
MRSPLDFGNSDRFRKDLVIKNLPPYKKSPFQNTPPFYYEATPFDNILSVKDTPDNLIDTPKFANELYTRNQYGKNGGSYSQVIDPNRLTNSKTNYGEYGSSKVFLLKSSLPTLNENITKNFYLGVNVKFNVYSDAKYYIEKDTYWFDPNLPKEGILYYWGEGGGSFVPSTYTPYGILMDTAETKANLAEDSYIARLSAQKLNEILEDRANAFISKIDTVQKFEQTIENINDPLDVYNLIIGRTPIIEPNWSITKPNNLLIGGAQLFIGAVGGELPFPTILGSYFDESIKLNGKEPRGFLGTKFQQKKTGSQLFYDNMGSGQRLVYYKNISENLYKPNYDRSDFLGSFLDLFTKNKSNYYVGNENLDVSDISSPPTDLPVDQFDRPFKAIVYGPTEISKVYEGEDFNPPTGLNGVNYNDGGGIEGGLTWVSEKYKENSGKNIGQSGKVFGDNNTKQTTYDLTESTNYKFKPGSILDDTQKLINSQPNGANRLKHVGNAIDQVSKVFNDGYKEITKGSKVKKYKYQNAETLTNGSFEEYCRLFTKDSPYMTYERLQKVNGITTSGRRMKSSVINNTYDLSITPRAGNDAKKYMLSIENLAWRTSDMYLDLPECEKGPNGGRIMWFPPYDLKVTDSSTANWNPNEFLGRPEPVYTYKNTARSGSIDFTIVVDHPSILNVISNKVLANESNSENINGILSSFFAGCLTYDIYDLAKIYNTMKLSELEEIQKMVKEDKTIVDQVSYIKRTVITGSDPISIKDTTKPIVETVSDFNKYSGYAFYFDNDIPKSSDAKYLDTFKSYTSNTLYDTTTFMTDYIQDNFKELNQFITECNNFLKNNDGSTISIELTSTASNPGTNSYNIELSKRRSKTIEKYLKDNIKSEKFTITKFNNQGEDVGVVAKSSRYSDFSVSKCTNTFDVTSQYAMACRRTAITNIKATKTTNPTIPITPPNPTTEAEIKVIKQITNVKLVETQEKVIKNISKKILQKLLNECDYFETIKETSPFIYNNLKEKIKYFNPIFHSTTPEGLNSRLTFLQQCVRPGDTIPTIRKDGVGEVRDAKNTAFGIPPVLILRVGDFFHTKIIPENLQISYDPLHWDINPEGIGFQPMIAKIQLSFKFVGASGLSNAVDKLQNALSFNYYANTEVYDPRAEKTDFSLDDMDKKIEDFIREKEKVEDDNKTTNDIVTNSFNTIGVIDTTNKTLDYYNLMVELINSANDYVNSLNNKIQNFSQKNGSAALFFLFDYLNYIDGVYSINANSEFKLFGIPSLKYKDKLFEYINEYQKNILDDKDDFIKKVNDEFKKSKTKEDEQFKLNYKKQTNKIILELINSIDIMLNDFVKIQSTFQKVLSKVLVVLSKYNLKEGYDGFVDKTGNVTAYELNSYQTLIENVLKGVSDAIKNNILYYSSNEIKNPKNILSGDEQYSFMYLLLYNAIMNDNAKETFKNGIKIVSNLSYKPTITQSNDVVSKIFDEYIEDVRNRFKDKNKEYSEKLDDFDKNSKKAINSLKTDITLNKDNFKVVYTENTNPDFKIKTVFITLNKNNIDIFDKEDTTWSINTDNFILTRNKLKL